MVAVTGRLSSLTGERALFDGMNQEGSGSGYRG